MRHVVLLGILLSAIPALTPWPVEAHDIYGKLLGPHGESCCDGVDCRPAPWRIIADRTEKWAKVIKVAGIKSE